MSDADKIVEVLLRFKQDGDLSKATDEIRNLTNVDEESGRKMIGSKRELMAVINELGGRSVPMLGHALATGVYGSAVLGGLFAVVGAFRMLGDAIEADAKRQAELNQMLAEGINADEVASNAASISDSLEKSGIAADEFTASLGKIASASETIRTQAEENISLIHAEMEAEQQKAEAKKRLLAAEIKEKEAAVQISHEQAEAALADLE